MPSKCPRRPAEAQSKLGSVYEHGRGLPGDEITALAWFILAAEQGNGTAAERRAALASRLSPAELEPANERARALAS